MDTPVVCPACELYHPMGAYACDCGHAFASLPEPPAAPDASRGGSGATERVLLTLAYVTGAPALALAFALPFVMELSTLRFWVVSLSSAPWYAFTSARVWVLLCHRYSVPRHASRYLLDVLLAIVMVVLQVFIFWLTCWWLCVVPELVWRWKTGLVPGLFLR